MPLKLKLDEEGHVVVEDGKPVYVGDDGKDIAYDANYTIATITRLNKENKEQRERAEVAENGLKRFEGIEDPEVALKALETVANLDQGTLITAGKVDEIKLAAKRAAEEQVAQAARASEQRIKIVETERDGLRDDLHREMIGGAFSRSKFIADKCAIPADFVQARFGPQFKYEEKVVVGYGKDGQKIYSRAKPGELAGFEEALEIMIESEPYKDQILKGVNNSGGGATHGQNDGGVPRQVKGDLTGNRQERRDAIASRFPDLPLK